MYKKIISIMRHFGISMLFLMEGATLLRFRGQIFDNFASGFNLSIDLIDTSFGHAMLGVAFLMVLAAMLGLMALMLVVTIWLLVYEWD